MRTVELHGVCREPARGTQAGKPMRTAGAPWGSPTSCLSHVASRNHRRRGRHRARALLLLSIPIGCHRISRSKSLNPFSLSPYRACRTFPTDRLRPVFQQGPPARTWHAARWPGATSLRQGSDSEQTGIRSRQRGWKRQPEGGSMGLGTSPSRMIRVLFIAGSGMGTALRRASVYGWIVRS